jgi:hypothetical protein
MTNFIGRNIKRRLQQLEVFNRSTSDSPPTTPKEKQQSCRTPPKESTKSKHTRRDSINPTASDTLLPNLETGNGLPAAVSPDDSSVQAFLFGSTGEAGNISSISNQENSNIASQQKNEITNVFDLTTPLTHLENDLILFVCLLQPLLLHIYSYWNADTALIGSIHGPVIGVYFLIEFYLTSKPQCFAESCDKRP